MDKDKKVVIIGRANVGKSTLFNRLNGRALAMVSNQPGTTRDLKYARLEWLGRSFELVDTGGFLAKKDQTLRPLTRRENKKLIKESVDNIDLQVEQRARRAIDEAALIIFLVDVKSGLTAQDKEIAAYLRQRQKERPVILTVNKCDNPRLRQQAAEFYALGLGEPVLISAANGSGTGDLLDKIIAILFPSSKLSPAAQKKSTEDENNETKPIRVAIIGKPNVGKSSLLNKFIGYDKVIVSPYAHTTREPNDETIVYDNRQIVLVDTAGLRRKSKVDRRGLEGLGVKMSLSSLKKSQLALLVLDGSQPISHQDLQLGKLLVNYGTGVIIVVNKVDLLKERTDDDKALEHYRDFVYQNFPHLKFAPLVFVSAKQGLHIQKIFKMILEVEAQSRLRLSDNALSKFLKALIKKQPPPRKRIGDGSKTKIKRSYITNFKQVGVAPPLFECTIGSREKLPEEYRRYIINNLRSKFGFKGVPIKLAVRYRPTPDNK